MKHVLCAALILATATVPPLALAQAEAVAPTAPSAKTALDPQVAAGIAEMKDPAELTQLVAYFRQAKDSVAELAALDRRIALRPHIGAYKLDKAVTLAREDRKSEAYTLLIELQNTGYAYDLRDDPRFANIATTEVWGYILDNFDSNREPFGLGTLAYTLPREDLLLESLAWDASRDKLLVGSAREGKVYVAETDGSITPLAAADADNGMWAVFDLAVDAERGHLWVASSAVPHYKGYDAEKDLGRAGVFKFDLASGKFLERFLSPPAQGGQGFMLTSIALGADGAVYAADGVNRAIYQVRDGQFRRILHLPMLSSISDITVSGDGGKLYFADPQLGILGVNLGTLKLFDVRVPEKLSLEGIGALAWREGALIAVQSGMNPRRVMRLGLSPQGDTIIAVQPLEANNPLFGRPGAITLNGPAAYVVANDQKDNYDRFGLLKKRDLLESTRIIKLDARFEPADPNKLGPFNFDAYDE